MEPAAGDLLVQPEERVGGGVPEKPVKPCYGSVSGKWSATRAKLHTAQARIDSHLRAGSLPKNATNVINEINSTISAMVVMVPITAGGQMWPVSLSIGGILGDSGDRSEPWKRD